MSNLLNGFIAEQIARLSKPFPEFRVGDTIVVKHKIRDEKGGERLQALEGLCISIRRAGLGSSFVVRKTAHGMSMEKVFPRCSPLIDSVAVVKKGRVRRAKLYYMRDRSGKMARVKQDISHVTGGKSGVVVSAASSKKKSA